MEWYTLVLQIAVTLAAVTPLVIFLVKYVQKAVKEKNWPNLMKLVLDLCVQAEEEIMTGADRKVWVIDMLTQLADSVGYDLSDGSTVQKVNDLIDSFIDATKHINVDDSDSPVYDPNQLSFFLDEN